MKNITTRKVRVAAAFLFSLLGLYKLSQIDAVVAIPQKINNIPATKQLIKPGATPLIKPGTTPLIKPGATPLVSTVDRNLVSANTKFGFKLFSELIKKQSNKNIFVSPSSVAIALAMTYNGANGTTQKAMAKTLELNNLSLQQINAANAILKTTLENADPQVQVKIANSLWANQDYPSQQSFLQNSQNFYNAQVSNLDFNNPNAPQVINNWVQRNTNGKINQIIDKIQPDDVLYLLNAIYFNGKWTDKFDKKQTANYPFYLPNKQQLQQPMMSQTGEYSYYENANFQAVSLPYGQNRRFSLYIFLPQRNSSLAAFYKNLNATNWEQWINQFSSNRQGFIRIPRFKIEYETTLNDALKALGMSVAFSPQADFSGISNVSSTKKKLSISEVKHKTFVEVNEAGTEAAAVTSVGVIAISAVTNLAKPFQMIVDRPFFCAIRDDVTGTILFMGAIVNPQ